MPYRLVGRYGRLAKAGSADERPVLRGLSCSHTAPLQYSQAGAVKRDKEGSSQRSSIDPSNTTHTSHKEGGRRWQHSMQAAAAATRLYTYALFLLPQQQCTARFVRRSSSSRPINSWQAYHGVMASHGAIVGNAH